ncbi:DNRLRE domain-containing protein [Sorangium sp. So ce119]|uniref:DNRLRE domain-containing protein n=1 Tax=Sorangium sp. So ce119 TaxID=3133279 RepID=UPI003F5DF89F
MKKTVKITILGAISTLGLAACDAGTVGQTGDFGGESGERVGRATQALSVCVDVQRGLPGSAVEDTFLDAAAPTHASGGSLLLYSGLWSGGEKRSLLKFDVGFIPAGSVIDSATLKLYQVWRTGESTVRVHKVTSPWSEATATWASSASSYDAAVASTIAAPSQIAGFVTADLTALVQGWSDAGDNQGIALEEDLVLKTEFKSSEEANAARRPMLSVCYTAPTCDDGVQNQGESGVDCGGPCDACPPEGVRITAPGEAYGHHGACEGWNGCGDAATCALWACEINGYPSVVSYGADAPCTEFDNCNLFFSRGDIEWSWGNWCEVRGVTDIVCGGAVPPPDPTCDDGVQNQGEERVDCGGPCAACPDGVLITAPGEAYGHHGACEGWNECGDAATCALWACEINGYSQLVSYGPDAPCTEFDNCHLFFSQGNIEWNWGNSCEVRGVTGVVCAN